jgi:hypothetical protein
VAPPEVNVQAMYPGVSAQELANIVAVPMENAMNGVDDMIYMSSTCDDSGVYSLTVTFEIGTDLNMAMVKVQNRVRQAEPMLPKEVVEQGVRVATRSSDMLGAIVLTSPNGTHDALALTDYSHNYVKDALTRVPGVGDTQMFGAQKSMRVWLDAERLSALGLDPGDVRRVIQTQNTLDGQTTTDQWTFDNVGRPFQHFFAMAGAPTTGERTVYRPEGYLSQVRSAYPSKNGSSSYYAVYREIQAMNARGQVTQESGSAGATYQQNRTYTPDGRLQRQLAWAVGGGTLQDFTYTSDLVGNLTSRMDQHARAGLTENLGYDALQRLTTSNVGYGGPLVQRGQSYDAEGNLRTKGSATYTYGTRPSACAANDLPGPHAVSEITGLTLCYDKSGNVVKKAGTQNQTLQYTAANQLADVIDTTNNTHVKFGYGPNRERIRRLDYANAQTTTADILTHESGDARIRYSANTANGAGTIQEIRRTVGNTIIVET